MTLKKLDKQRFLSLWQRQLHHGASDDGVRQYQRLMDYYNEPQRCYHNPAHINHCLNEFDCVADRLSCPDAVELSIWFHDCIYQTGEKNNEQRSADYFMACSEKIMSDELRDNIYTLIMATVHDGLTLSSDAQYLNDIDLSSFGLPWEQFIVDSQNVRDEFSYVSDQDFFPKQMAFQKSLLARPRFFYSDYFYQKYESQARQNLADYFELIKTKIAQA